MRQDSENGLYTLKQQIEFKGTKRCYNFEGTQGAQNLNYIKFINAVQRLNILSIL